MRGLKYPGSPFGAVPYIGDQIFIKFRFMAYHEDTAFIGQQSPLQFCLGVHIQMIDVYKRQVSGMCRDRFVCMQWADCPLHGMGSV